jgi:transcriptional regulator with XRE-family HTH domain
MNRKPDKPPANIDAESLMRRISSACRERNITLQELAHVCNLDTAFISDLESGRCEALPGPAALYEMSRVLGLATECLFASAGYSVILCNCCDEEV